MTTIQRHNQQSKSERQS